MVHIQVSRARRSRIVIELPGTPGLYLLSTEVPPGWEVVGTVTDAECTGALIHCESNGIYCRANVDVIHSLPQRKVQQAIEAAQAGNLSLPCAEKKAE